MSFPSANAFMNANPGSNPEHAMLHAIEHDTPLAHLALTAISMLVLHPKENPLTHLKHSLHAFGAEHEMGDLDADVLRCEKRGKGLKFDFDPDSKMGRQLSRIMGTDVTRPLMVESLGVELGFANCCGIIASERREDVRFTAEDQVRWQLSIDC
jgi:hypothetical protein